MVWSWKLLEQHVTTVKLQQDDEMTSEKAALVAMCETIVDESIIDGLS